VFYKALWGQRPYNKRCSSEKSSLMGEAMASKGKDVISSARTKDFLLLAVENSMSYSWRITIYRENLPLICHRLSKYYMWLEYAMTLVIQSMM
jgi:hypothetical protein